MLSLKHPVTNVTLYRGVVLWFPGFTQLSQLLVHSVNELSVADLNSSQYTVSQDQLHEAETFLRR